MLIFKNIIRTLLSNTVNSRRDLAILYSRLAINFRLKKKWLHKTGPLKTISFWVIMFLLEGLSVYALFGVNCHEINHLTIVVDFFTAWLDNPTFSLEYKYIYIICKVFAFTVANYIFAKNFITDFCTKHKFSFNEFDWESVKKYIYKFILFFIFMIVCRFIIRNCLLHYFFNNTKFISIVLCALWILPLSNYVMNIVMKLITKQKIEKKDWDIFNKHVAENTNIYTICFILVIVYISYFYLQHFYLLLLNNCLNLLGMGEGRITFSLPHLDKNTTEWLLKGCENIIKDNILPKTTCILGIAPLDYPLMFNADYGSWFEKDSPAFVNGKTTNHWFMDRLIGNKSTPNLRYVKFDWNAMGNTEVVIRRNTSVMNAIVRWEATSKVKFLINTMVISHNTSFPSLRFGLVVGKNPNSTNTLYIGIQDKAHSNKNSTWGLYHITESQDMEKWRQNLVNWGIDTSRIFELPISDIKILTPFRYESGYFPGESKYYQNDKMYKTPSKSNSVIVDIHNLTHIGGICNLPPYPLNLEGVFTERSLRESFKVGKSFLIPYANNLHGIVMLTSNISFIGYTWLEPAGTIIQIIHNNSNLPLVRNSIQSNYVREGVAELNENLGINLKSNNIIHIYTQVDKYNKNNFYQLPMFSYGYDNFENTSTVINFPFSEEKFDGLPIRFTKFVKDMLECLYGRQYYSSEVTSQNQYPNFQEIQEKVWNRDLMKALEESILIYAPYNCDNNTTIYKMNNSNRKLIVCRSSQSILEELFWNNNSSLTIKHSIDPTIRKLIDTPLYSKDLNDIIQDSWNCFHYEKTYILFIDKFCVELATVNIGCRKNCDVRRPISTDAYKLANVIYKDNNGNEKKIFNLLDTNDLKQFFSFFKEN